MKNLILSLSSTWLMTIALSSAPAIHAAETPANNNVTKPATKPGRQKPNRAEPVKQPGHAFTTEPAAATTKRPQLVAPPTKGERIVLLGNGLAAGWSKGGDGEPTQLYDMSKDIGERTNEYKSHPEIVARLTKLLEKYIADGRSTPGAPQKNDAAVIIRKKAAPIDETAN
jgi:hypothetical protein